MLNRRFISIYIVTTLLLCSACGSEEGALITLEVEEPAEEVQLRVGIDSSDNATVEEERPFEMYYHQLLMSLASQNPASFNDLIHPERGCYLIESPGAIPVMTRITNVEMAMQAGKNRSVLNLTNSYISFALQEESLPTIDCDSPDGFYSKEGTFVEDINTLTDEKIWVYLGLEASTQDSIAHLAQTINKTIINTAAFKAYFSKIEGQWYLTFFDIRVPCTA